MSNNNNNNGEEDNPFRNIQGELVNGLYRNCNRERIINTLVQVDRLAREFDDRMSTPGSAAAIEEQSPITQPRPPYNFRPRRISGAMVPSPPTNAPVPTANEQVENATEDTLRRHVDGINAIATAPEVDVDCSSSHSLGELGSFSFPEFDMQPSDRISGSDICTRQFAGISQEENTRSAPATLESSRTSRGSSVEKEKNGGNIQPDVDMILTVWIIGLDVASVFLLLNRRTT